MGFRFRKSVRIAPGVRINLGKKKASLSIGGRGATVNLSDRGVKTTVGIPGTGMSYVDDPSSKYHSSENYSSRKWSRNHKICLLLIIIFFIWYMT